MEKIREKLKNLKPNLYATWFGISNPWGSDSFTTVDGTLTKVTTAINFFIAISALVAVGVIVYGAYLMIIAGGDGDKIEQGQSTIQAGIVGMVLVFIAGAAIRFVVTQILKI